MSIKNSVHLIGRITKDVDLKYTPSGVAVASISLAVQRDRKTEKGDYEVDYPNIVVWQKSAENLANYCKKGDKVGIDGRLQTRTCDGKDGKKVYVTEVVTNSVEFLSVKGWENKENGINKKDANQKTRIDEDPFANDGKKIDISDDDLPF